MLDLFLKILRFSFYSNMDWRGLAMLDTVDWYRKQQEEEQRQQEEYKTNMRKFCDKTEQDWINEQNNNCLY